jgi:hypothetical protein
MTLIFILKLEIFITFILSNFSIIFWLTIFGKYGQAFGTNENIVKIYCERLTQKYAIKTSKHGTRFGNLILHLMTLLMN